ncbi:MAG TPA: group 1 truncated hemoglobin [Pyrinomonadaceae bacterium]|jgi:hemoglobin|nr:group 1 truncated hemoglobin [Pyrinomonadaceae bacterium]
MTRRIRRIGAAVCLLAALTATAARVSGGARGQTPAEKSLYERLGGLDAISAVVDEFIRIASADERINKKFAKTAQPERVRLHFIEQICMLTGGPCKYTGDSMKKAHPNMGLTEGEFGAGVEDLTQALDKFNVPAREKGEFLTALAQFKKEIVEVKSNETGTPLPANFKPAPALPQERIKAGPAMKGGRSGGRP